MLSVVGGAKGLEERDHEREEVAHRSPLCLVISELAASADRH